MPRSTPRRTFAALGLAVASFATLQSLIVPVLPVIQAELHTTTAGVTWAVTAWLVSAAVTTPLVGRIGDIAGRRRTFLVAVAGVALGSLVAAAAPTIGVLIVARVIQGLGGAMFPLAFGLLREAFPPARLAGAIGAMSAMLAIGSGLGTVLAGPLAGLLGWRGLFLVPLVLIAIGGLLTALYVPESRERATGGVNAPAAVLLSGWLVALLLPLSQGAIWGWGSPLVVGLFVAAAALLVAWVAVELRSRVPLVDIRMLASPRIWPMNLAGMLNGAAMFGVFAFFPRFVQTPASTGWGLGASVAASGLLMLPMLVTMGVAGFLSGPLARIIGSRTQVAVAGALMVVATVAIALAHSTAWMLMVEAAVFGLGLGIVYAAITSVVVQSVPPTQTGVASGMNTNLRTIGSSIGVTVMTAVVAGTIGPSGIPTEAGYTAGFLAVAAIGAGAVLAAVVAILLARRFAAPASTGTVATTAVTPFAEEEVVALPETERAA
ncbi:MFS transporter [Pseudolysinimonas sp.]|uniref:MFS transporter n=1 Tax=Pseudolysinimonas sp. TaxID=2680009 RepID=UPI003F7F6D5A